ncbi:MAG: AtpZ/AtpI family protein [Capsulimonadaceae bacterium]
MADDYESAASSGDGDEHMPAGLPDRDPLPPPPEVHYTRPRSAARNNPDVPDNRRYDVNAGGGSPASAGRPVGLASGVSLAAAVLAGYWIGSQIDERLHTVGIPWATLSFVLLGTFVGFYNLFRMLNGSKGPGSK